MPTSSDERLVREVDAELARAHPNLAGVGTGLELDRRADSRVGNCRVASPVEPCPTCGYRVYLILVDGDTRPRWMRLGEVLALDTLFPTVQQILHECGLGDAWSVEAALFAEQTMAEWSTA